jgi:hypothetical protein
LKIDLPPFERWQQKELILFSPEYRVFMIVDGSTSLPVKENYVPSMKSIVCGAYHNHEVKNTIMNNLDMVEWDVRDLTDVRFDKKTATREYNVKWLDVQCQSGVKVSFTE